MSAPTFGPVHRDTRVLLASTGSMIVREFMTEDPITIDPDAPLSEAFRAMEEHAVRHLLVTTGRRLVGVLSNRDLFELTPSELEAGKVRAAMHAPVTVAPDDSAVSAACELILGRIGCLPVLEDEALVGVLSEFDVLRLYERVCREGGRVGEVDPPVEHVATADVVHVAPDTPLREVRELLATLGVRHVPVLQGEHVVGILSDRDLRRAQGRSAGEDSEARDFMTTPVLTATPSDRLSQTALRMADHKVGAVVICRNGDRLAGILTLTDVLDFGLETLRDPDLAAPRRP